MADAEEILHDAADRLVREALDDADNLRALLRAVLGPDDAAGFDTTKRRDVSRDFLMPNLRGKERDFICEVPYRLADGTEEWAWVCVMIEHQTRSDPWMPFRMLTYAVFYWDKCFRDWEKTPAAERGKFKFPPIVPIVFHASSGRWKGAKTMQELLGEPSAFHTFAPVWKPLFWEVGERGADELLANEDAFMQVLAVVRAEDAELNEAMRVYREFMNRVGELRDANKPRWLELVRFALLWVANRRPEEERAEWIRATEESQNERLALEEVRNMENTIAHSWLKEGIKIGDAQGMAKGIEKGIEKGMEKGRSEGRSEGRIEGARSMILRLGRRRFGVPTDSQSAALEAMNDIVRLESLGDMVSDASSWDDLLRMG